ncbi:MAG: tRNA lysidine(34) synthetase TilS, partial [Muribaculaceae bacterium]|nr:tRNA lysidine(34) synthetase TilS [Muribaculaceae bacterium]
NFHLRGDESDRDEAFARETARNLGCEIRVRHFDVARRRAETGESVEMACRELRYKWFADEYEAANGAWGCVAVGHHADDNVETFFLNLLRGSGLKGLCGISSRRGVFVRPMLGATRRSIVSFLEECGLRFVVDSSNLSNDYKRNVLRNKVIPALEQDFPNAGASVGGAMQNLRRDRDLLEMFLERERSRMVDHLGVIDLGAVCRMPHAATLLFHLMNMAGIGSYGFATAEAVLRSAAQSGREFRADSGCGAFLLDRGRLVPVSGDDMANAGLTGGEVRVDPLVVLRGGVVENPRRFSFERLDKADFKPARDASVMWLDADAVAGEDLVFRQWRNGDRICPFGMKGSRLVSDILSDAKVALTDKRRVWLLCAADKVLWVPGLRASRHFVVDNHTCSVLKISLLSSDKS